MIDVQPYDQYDHTTNTRLIIQQYDGYD